MAGLSLQTSMLIVKRKVYLKLQFLTKVFDLHNVTNMTMKSKYLEKYIDSLCEQPMLMCPCGGMDAAALERPFVFS